MPLDTTCSHCGRVFRSFPSDRRRYCSRLCTRLGLSISPETRFWAKVRKTDRCWLWTAAVNSFDYGKFSVARSIWTAAHRVAWEMASGEPIPDGLIVGHACDVPRCVRNDEPGMYLVDDKLVQRFGHLRLGTADDNARDMADKGRATGASSPGERNPAATLTDEQVREIRARWPERSQRDLASLFGISRSTVQNIVHGRRWTHL